MLLFLRAKLLAEKVRVKEPGNKDMEPNSLITHFGDYPSASFEETSHYSFYKRTHY